MASSMYPDVKSETIGRRRHRRGPDGEDLFARLDIGDRPGLGRGDGRVATGSYAHMEARTTAMPAEGSVPTSWPFVTSPRYDIHLDRSAGIGA